MKKLCLIASLTAGSMLSGCGADREIVATEYDTSRPYYLPFEEGRTRKFWQVVGGTHSHDNLHAFDVAMDIGSTVLAARDGEVYNVVENHSRTCRTASDAATGPCTPNRILISQGEIDSYGNLIHDGTVGRYLHLDTNKVCVEEGDLVRTGDIIALSGDVGWSSAPHLHFEVMYLDGAGGWNPPPATLPTFVDVNAAGTGTPGPYSLYTSANKFTSENTNWCAVNGIAIPDQDTLNLAYNDFIEDWDEELDENLP